MKSERKRLSERAWKLAHPRPALKRNRPRGFFSTAKEQRRAGTVKRYGLSWENYLAMREWQENKCAVCKEPFAGEPCVDHNHATGAVRGLLCGGCNGMIGLGKDSPNTLRRGAHYLELRA